MKDETSGVCPKIVFAVRHGKQQAGGVNLSDLGKEQIHRLREILRRLVPTSYKVLILSSPISRARESANIIGEMFGVEHQVCDELRGDDWEDGQKQVDAILAVTDGADVVIAVTHYQAPSGIAHALASSRFERAVDPEVSDNGNGFMVSLETGDVVSDLLVS